MDDHVQQPRLNADSEPSADFDFDSLARSISGPEHSVRVWPIITSGVVVALIVLSFIYRWAPWVTIGLVAVLGAIVAAAYFRRPPAAPVELTANERDRVGRVLDEHGTRAAVSLVRALYPTEPNSAALRTVQQLAARRKASSEDSKTQRDF